MEEVKRIECRGENGSRYTVVVYQRVVTHRPLSGSAQSRKGSFDLRLDDGRHVTALNDQLNTFKLIDTGEVIRRV